MMDSSLFSFFFWSSCLIVVTSQQAPDLSVGVLPQLFVHGDHFSVGQQIGYATKDSIKFRLDNSPSVQSLVEWVTSTVEGRNAYDAMLLSANQTFPQYVKELEGMSYGCGVDFVVLFTLNVRKELSTFKKNGEDLQDKIEHCSDYLVNGLNRENGRGKILIGHNEDGGWESRDTSCLVTAHMYGENIREEIRFMSFVYPGELPTDAFFWNEHGVIGTMNGLYPVKSLYGGLGRNFISRDLVGAKDIDDAIARCTVSNQATGHSFNLASTKEKRLLNIEVAPGVDTPNKESLVVVTPVPEAHHNNSVNVPYLFHANKYMFLDVEENPSDSSQHRMDRAAELPKPTDADGILLVLGDTEDEEYPIYRTSTPDTNGDDTGYTLATALFSIHFGGINKPKDSVTLYLSNPYTNQNVRITKPLHVE